MNKPIMFLVMGLLCFSGSGLADSWHIETVDTGDAGWYNSIALDSSDYPHISYCGYGTLKYARWTGSTWYITTLDTEYYEPVGYYTSIALDSSDYPHISYSNRWYCNLKYAYWNGSSWSISTVYSSADDTSIALDSSDYPHISYLAGYSLMYAYWNGSAWSITPVDTVGDAGYNISMALDSAGNPHISYWNWNNYDLKYAYWTGSVWSITSVDTPGIVGWYNSIALDSSDYPHISYLDETNLDLKYAYWNGSEWSITSVDTAGHVGWYTSIALDSSDNPHISYIDGDNLDLKYAFWNGSTWFITSVDSAASVNFTCSISLDSSDNPHISYYDASNHYLKYAWYGPDTTISLLSFTATPQEDFVALNWQVECTEGEQIAGFNLYRREITPNSVAEAEEPPQNKDDWTKVNSSLIIGQNPYAYTDAQVVPDISYEYRLEAVLNDQCAQTLGTCQATTGQLTSFAITQLYPNPASDVLNIALTLPQAGEVTLELYDLTGRVVASKDIQIATPGELTDQLDVSGLANGVYTLRATQANLSASERAVVVR